MPRCKRRSEPKYLIEFLEQYTVPELKQLTGLVASNLPACKAEIDIPAEANPIVRPKTTRSLVKESPTAKAA